MEQLKRLIGPAPSEQSESDLLTFIKARQALIANTLQEFRNRMIGAVIPTRQARVPKVKKEDLNELLRQMKELGLTVEDLKKVNVHSST